MSALRMVLKYELDIAGGCQHAIPDGSFFLDAQMQNGRPVMWWSVPYGMKDKRLRTFLVAPTGPPGYTANLHYVGTFQAGGFVGHVLSHQPVPRTLDEGYAETTDGEAA